MLFELFTDDDLSQYSYAVGCKGARNLAIVDPRRDVDVYLRYAEREGVEITHVLETHIHADFASGARELAERAGAELLVSAHDRGEQYEVAFEHTDLSDGDEVRLGSVRIRALHTPGHTPEHLSYLIFDEARAKDEPLLLLSGDFLFVGSLGRPDLLGEEAKRDLAGRLHDSIRRVLDPLPDGLEVHPGHGAGSMCGSGMSGRPQSTLGYERASNPYLARDLDRDGLVRKILADPPPFPDYYRRMKRLNSAGPRLLAAGAGATADGPGLPGVTPLPGRDVAALAEKHGAVMVDVRHRVAFGGAHVPRSFGIGLDGKLSTWASWLVPYQRPIVLVADDAKGAEQAVRKLVRVGLDEIAGYLDGGIMAWPPAGGELATLPQWTPAQAHEAASGDAPTARILDVRGDAEWDKGHAPGALHVMAGELVQRLDEVREDGRTIAVVCGSGYRSTAAASVLLRHGFQNVVNVLGGMTAWEKAGLPVERS